MQEEGSMSIPKNIWIFWFGGAAIFLIWFLWGLFNGRTLFLGFFWVDRKTKPLVYWTGQAYLAAIAFMALEYGFSALNGHLTMK